MINVSLETLGILKQPGPRDPRSVHIAQGLYDHLEEIEMLANEQGQLYQDTRAARQEWCRLVAMLIEVYLGVKDETHDGGTRED